MPVPSRFLPHRPPLPGGQPLSDPVGEDGGTNGQRRRDIILSPFPAAWATWYKKERSIDDAMTCQEHINNQREEGCQPSTGQVRAGRWAHAELGPLPSKARVGMDVPAKVLP